MLNQFWQILLKGKEEIRLPPRNGGIRSNNNKNGIYLKLPTIEELVFKIKNEKDNDLNLNIDNNDIRND